MWAKGNVEFFPQAQSALFGKLEVSASSSEKTFVLDINLYFHKFGIADPIDREDADPIDPIDPIDRKDADPIDPIDRKDAVVDSVSVVASCSV